MKMKTNLLVALVVGMMSAPMAANADVTQLIHFDDASNGWKWYSDVDLNFLFDPTNLQSASLCADSTNGGNGSCVIEGTQGVLPKMTRPTNGPVSQGGGDKDDPGASGTELFTLDAFYFLLTGKGTGAENAITATGSNGASYTFQLGGNYDATGAPDVTFYEGVDAGDLAGYLVKNTGYIVEFGNLFKDVTYIQFSAPDSAQVRLDCVVATFNGTTTEPRSEFNQPCGTGAADPDPNPDPLPEPATLALLGLGLAGLGFSRRKQ